MSVELKGARINLEAMKKQNEGTQREYDRVAEEYQKLQVSCNILSEDVHPH